jgi:HD-GYP domain-containing protein (c-di-GMP phosphodiesterase class II)
MLATLFHPFRRGGKAAAVLAPEPAVESLVEESRARRLRAFGDREIAVSMTLVGAFGAVAAAMVLLLPLDRHASPFVWIGLILAYAGASRVEFEVGSGAAVPTQLVFVPMLFLLPTPAVPIAVAAGLLLGSLPDHVRGDLHPARAFVTVINAWHAVGPALVLALAGPSRLSWSVLPVYLAAFAAQILCDGACAVIREYVVFRIHPREVLGYLAWTWVVDALLAPVGLAVAIAGAGVSLGFLASLPLVALLRLFAHEREARMSHAIELNAAYRGTAFLLGDVLEADHAYTGEHSKGVVDLTLAVADILGLDPNERQQAEFTALLHDVGKLHIPKEIIDKPGALTAEERAIIETHTVEGERILTQIGGVLAAVGHLVRSCHERWDGTGYPDRLAGDQTPLISRIVCACDAYSAMTTDRPYRAARSPEAAVQELRRCAGSHFDPRVISALADVIEGQQADDLPRAA